MKVRPRGFLGEEYISHDGEIFDYIAELHAYLWRVVYVVLPVASGNLGNYLDIVMETLEHDGG